MSEPDTQAPPAAPDAAIPAPDMSQYIRTYAKDVAQLSGKGNVGAIQKTKPAKQKPEPEKAKGEVSDGVEFDAVDQPFFEAAKKPEEAPREMVQLESRTELDQYVDGGAPAPTQPEKAVEEERSALLARLRAKTAVPTMSTPVPDVAPAAQPAVVETPKPAPVFAEPKPEPVHPMPPLYREPIEEVPPPAPLPKPVPAPIPTPKPQAAAPFHSFSTDFKDRTAKTNASSFSVLAAGLDAGQAVAERSAPTTSERPPVFVLVGGALLLLLAAGGAYAGYLYIGARHEVPAIVLSVPSLIFADEYKKLEGSGAVLMDALATTATDPVAPSTAVVTYVGYPATEEAGTIAGTPAPGGYLIKALALAAPELLLRNTLPESTVGVINEGGDTKPFFIFRVSSYERTFAAMLTWEPRMMRELAVLYPLYPEEAFEPQVDLSLVATSTASTSPALATSTPVVAPVAPAPVTVSGRFVDAVVANRDVRILRDSRGRSIMLYGYADRETLIVARNEAAFAALLVRLSAGAK